MQKDSAQAKISLKVVGGLLFLTHPVYIIYILLALPVPELIGGGGVNH